jgi:hypothetical protein
MNVKGETVNIQLPNSQCPNFHTHIGDWKLGWEPSGGVDALITDRTDQDHRPHRPGSPVAPVRITDFTPTTGHL